MSGPVGETERISSIDVLRGFALLGILLMNMQLFAMPFAAYSNPTVYGDLTGASFWAWSIPHVFADLKFISIFSMLFGAGVLLMGQRAENRGMSAARLHYRRMGWMILFGVLHAYLLWNGDILFSYGVVGLVIYLFRRMKPRTLVALGVVLGMIPMLILAVIGLSMAYWPPGAIDGFSEDNWRPNQKSIDEELAAHRGSYLDLTAYRSLDTLVYQLIAFPMLLAWRIASLMLIGMALFKLGALHAQWSRGRYLLLIASGIFVGIPVIALGIYQNFHWNWDLRALFFGVQYNYWGSYLVALGWVGLIMIWCQSKVLPSLKARFAALGRTAFSNYILQTIVCTTIFYGYGLGYFGSVDRLRQVLLTLAIFAAQVMLAPLWLRYFSLGPLEWLWRRLTYGKPQPIWR
jgi:uncharacterized protein